MRCDVLGMGKVIPERLKLLRSLNCGILRGETEQLTDFLLLHEYLCLVGKLETIDQAALLVAPLPFQLKKTGFFEPSGRYPSLPTIAGKVLGDEPHQFDLCKRDDAEKPHACQRPVQTATVDMADHFIEKRDKGMLMDREYLNDSCQRPVCRYDLSGSERSQILAAASSGQIFPSHISPYQTLFPETDGKIASGTDVARALDSGLDFVIVGRAAILHHDFPERVRANPDFRPVSLPVTTEYLRSEGLSPAFIAYMGNWKGFVAAA